MELEDIKAFIKEQQGVAKRVDAAIKKAARLGIDIVALQADLAAIAGVVIGDSPQIASPQPSKQRAAINVTVGQTILVQDAVSDILRHNPGHAFTPSELVGATHLGKKTIAAVFRKVGFSEKGGKFTAPPQGDDHAEA